MPVVTAAVGAPEASAALLPTAAAEPPYSPSALLNIFNNAINVAQARRLVHVRGVYAPGRGTSYNGTFYDSLRDEATDASMTLVVPGLLRARLQPGALIQGHGCIVRKVVAAGGRIELQIHLDSLLEAPRPAFSEEDLRALDLQQQKAVLGYRDPEALLRARLLAGEPARIVVLIGKTAIIDADITHSLGAAATAFDLRFHRVNLHSERAILDALAAYDDEDTDLLIISRGGGEGVGIFNSCALAEACLRLTPHFLTAIGHKEDVTLVQRIADRAFITPTALGGFLASLHDEVAEAVHNSKAALIETVTRQLGAQHEGQLKILAEKLTTAEAVHTERAAMLAHQLRDREAVLAAQREVARGLQAQVDAMKKAGRPVWLYILVAALAGVVVGAMLAAMMG